MHRMVHYRNFETVITVLVAINMFFLCIEFHGAPDWYIEILEYANIVFVVIFTAEAFMKITACGFSFYLTIDQNKFDFFLVVISLLGLLDTIIPLNLTALRVVRGTRVLRIFKSLHVLNELLTSMYLSLRSFFYVFLMSTLFIFMFGLLGMHLFDNIEKGHYHSIGEKANFHSFGSSIITLWVCATGGGWNSFMHDTMHDNGTFFGLYWIAFYIIIVYIFMNIVIAVVFEKLEERASLHDLSSEAFGFDDVLNMFVNTWFKIDPQANGLIQTKLLPVFLMQLKAPLGFNNTNIRVLLSPKGVRKLVLKQIYCMNIHSH